jgi:PAS domain S-box-containing protein
LPKLRYFPLPIGNPTSTLDLQQKSDTMADKIKVSTKLYLLVFAMFIFIIGIGVYGIVEMKIMNRNTQTLYADRVVPLQQLTRIRFSYTVGILSSAEQVQNSRLTFSEAGKRIEQAEMTISDNWKAYLLTYLTSEEGQLARQASVLMNQSAESIEKLKAILGKGDSKALDNFINKELYPAASPVVAKITELIDLQVRVSGELYDNNRDVYDAAIRQFSLLIVLSLLFAIPFSYYLVRNVKVLITNLRYSNEKIMESEKKYHSVVEHAGDAIFLLNEDTSLNHLNTSACELLGYSREEVFSLKFRDVLSADELKMRPLQWELLKKNKAILSERRLKKKDGTDVDVELNIRVLEGKGYLAIARDITERKKIEEVLRESEKKYRNLFENVQDVFFQTTLAGIVVEASPSLKNHTGFDPEEVIGTQVTDLYYNPAEREKGLHILREKGEVEDYEVSLKSSTGEPVYVSLNARLIPGPDGSQSHIDGVFRNITERKKVAEKLKQSEASLKEAQAIAHICNWDIDMVNDIHMWSEEFYNIFGINKGDVQPSTEALLSFMHPDDLAGAQAEIAEAFVTLRDSNSNFRFFRKDGSMRHAYIEWRFEFNKDKRPIRLYGILQDITERKEAEESIRQSEANYRQLFKLSPAPMWVLDEETHKFTQVNQACINHYGYSEEEFAGMTIMNISPQNDETAIGKVSAKANQVVSFSSNGFRHIKKSGEMIDMETSSIPVILNGEKQILGIAIDVTEKNLYEQKLTRAAIKAQEDERYEIGGELHDNVCQILAASLMFLGMTKVYLSPEALEVFDKTNEYIILATEEIRNLSHRLAPAFFDESTLEDAFKNLLISFNAGKKYDISLDFDDPARRHPLNRDLQLNLYRILQEQLRNILKHANATGIIVEVSINSNKLRMKIADNGVGFDVGDNKGGIGFANMNRRVQLFAGNFTVHSAAGMGCEILVEIPLSNAI